jgi:hypothetical protein
MLGEGDAGGVLGVEVEHVGIAHAHPAELHIREAHAIDAVLRIEAAAQRQAVVAVGDGADASR